MQMIPLGKPSLNRGAIIEQIKKVLDSGWIAGAGPATERFERALERYLNLPAGYTAIAVSSGTAALHMAIKYHTRDIPRPLNILCPSYSFISTASAVGMPANYMWGDIDCNGCNMDPSVRVHGIPDVIIPVHQYGVPYTTAELDTMAYAPIIEDAACALGSEMEKGRKVGASGNLVCFSLHARKTLTCGEGGVIVVPPSCDKGWFLRERNFGMLRTPYARYSKKEYADPSYVQAGFNFKMSDIQAAVALAQLCQLNNSIDRRRKLYRLYENHLPPGVNPMRIRAGSNHQNLRVVFPNQDIRDYVRDTLRAKGIMVKNTIQPIHREPCIKATLPRPLVDLFVNAWDGQLPNTLDASTRGLWLPMYDELAEEQVHKICEEIKHAVESAE